MYVTGETKAIATSYCFNITDPSAPTTSPVSNPSSSGSGLSTGAKAGLGIGIPCAIAVGAVVGWFASGRMRRPAPGPALIETTQMDQAPIEATVTPYASHGTGHDANGAANLPASPSSYKPPNQTPIRTHELPPTEPNEMSNDP
jgi:hypothetical protein